MVSPLTDKIYDLDMSRAFSIDRAHQRTIRCIETHLWITEEGWSDDVILAPGQSHTIKGDGRVVISTLGKWSRFTITARRGWLTRFGRWMHHAWQRKTRRREPCSACQIGSKP